jgi:hypothetical protein
MFKSSMFFEIYFKHLPEPVSEVWIMFADHLRLRGLLPTQWHVSTKTPGKERTLRSENVAQAIRTERLAGFNLQSSDSHSVEIGFRLNPVASHVSFFEAFKSKGFALRFSCDLGAAIPKNWSDLIEQYCRRWMNYGAFQFDARYQSWQRCSIFDDYYFRKFGAPPPSMARSVVPNPPPVHPDRPERIVLDVSKNPGRTSHRDGQFRYVAAEMWLGNDFFEYAPCTREEILAAEFFLNVREEPNFIYFQAWPHPFTRPEGEQGRVQQKLWQLLFHEDCEWPPGSGGISDELIYGPPELMPGFEASA